MLKILLLADKFHANSLNFIEALENSQLVNLQVLTFDLRKSEKNSKLYYVKRGFAFASIFLKIRIKIFKFKPDIIIGYRTTSYGAIATRFHKHAKIVVAMQGVSDIYPFDNWSAPIKRRIQHQTFQRASLIQAWGMTQQQNALLNGADPNKLFVMPRGINLDNFSFGKQFDHVETVNWIVSRSLSKEYNHEMILRCFSKFANSNFGEHHLYIAGEGPLNVYLSQIVDELNIQNQVTFLGRIPNHVLSKLLTISHIYVSLPITEGVSASLLEAMACGCIPVVTDLPSNREWIEHRKNGILTQLSHEDLLVHDFQFVMDNLDVFIEARIQNRKIVEARANQRNNTLAFIEEYKKLLK
jgi:glycosyltransferase involved in cell wall biosynthesis